MENNKALTISLITIACLATVLALLWILRGWIMKLWDKMCECFGRNGEKEFEKVKDLDAAKIVPQPCFEEEVGEEEIYAPPTGHAPPATFINYWEKPGYIPLEERIDKIREQSAREREERERENKLKGEERERESRTKKKQIDEDYARDIKEIDENYAERERKIDDEIIELGNGKYTRGLNGKLCLASSINPRPRRDSGMSSSGDEN